MSPSFSSPRTIRDEAPSEPKLLKASIVRAFCFLLLAFALCGFGQAHAVSYTWNGTVSDKWNIAGNWTPAGVPSTNDTATIPYTNGAVVDGTSVTAVNTINLNGGGYLKLGTTSVTTFNLNDNSVLQSGIVTAANFNWAYGYIGATLNINTGGKLKLTGDNNKILTDVATNNAGTINNAGSTTMTGAGILYGGHGSVINNKSLGTFTVQGTGGIYDENTNNPFVFNNQTGATFTRNTLNTTIPLYVRFNNAGIVNTQTGTLQFIGDYDGSVSSSGESTGTFNTSSGARTEFYDPYGTTIHKWNAGTTFIGSGRAALVSGTAVLTGAVNVGKTGAVGVLEISGGIVHNGTGGSLNTTGASTIDWSNGQLGITVNIAASGLFKVTGDGSKYLYEDTVGIGGTINNSGIATQSGTGTLYGRYGSVINNKSGGSFTAQSDSGLPSTGTEAPSVFNNLAGATFNRNTSAGAYYINWIFNNAGTVNTQTGTLQLAGAYEGTGGTSSGTFNTSTGARTEFLASANTIHTWNTGTTFTGAGRAALTAGVVVLSGTANVGKSGAAGFLEISGGVLRNINTGSLNTVGTSTIEWSYGEIGAPVNVAATGLFKAIGTNAKALFDSSFGAGGIINNSGIATLTGAGGIYGNYGSTINNKNGGTFTVQNDSTLDDQTGGVGPVSTFNNLAGSTFTRNTTSGTFTVGWPFNNAGTVNTQTGILQFRGAYTAGNPISTGTSSGTFNTSNNARTEFNDVFGGAVHTWNTGTNFTGIGRAVLAGGKATLGGTVNVGKTGTVGILEISGGKLRNKVGGTLNTVGASAIEWLYGDIGATVNIASTGLLKLTGNNARNLFDSTDGVGGTINNIGITTLTGSGGLTGSNGSVFNNKSGGTFTVQGDSGLSTLTNGTPATFNNLAGSTFTRNTSTALITVFWAFNNAATVNTATGTLQFVGDYNGNGGTSTGTFSTSNNARTEFGSYNNTVFNWNSGTTFLGIGRSALVSGIATLGGTVNVGKTGTTGILEISGGTVRKGTNGSLNTVGASSIAWSGGRIGTPVNVATTGILTITNNPFLFDVIDGGTSTGGTINNSGTTNLNGDLQLDFGAVVNNLNLAVFNTSGNRNLLWSGYSNTTLPSLRNSGLLNVGGPAAARTLYLQDVSFVQAATGILGVDIAGANAGTGYDVLTVADAYATTATVNLLGTLNAQTSSGYLPPAASNWQILQYPDGARAGTFTTVTSPFRATYNTTNVTLDVPTSPNANSIFVSVNTNTLTEGGTNATGTITRTGSKTAALTVTLTPSVTGQLTVPATVTIPANSSAATFTISAVNDTVADGTANVTLTGSATSYNSGSTVIQVADNESPTLSLTYSATSVTEGGASITGTVTRNTPTTAALSVTLTASPSSQLTLSSPVVIPAGSDSATFTVAAVDDANIDGNVVVTITGQATGLTPATSTVTAIDNDTPTLTLNSSATSVTEGGASATGTVTRSGATTAALTVTLSTSPTSQLTVPTTVTIPAGSASSTFGIVATDDTAIDSNVAVTITAAATTFVSGTTVVTAVDNDAPVLTLSSSAASVAEGGASVTGTVTRSGATTAALTVNLSTSPTSQLTVPSTVTIPVGSASTTFTITAFNDTNINGDVPVTITAAATTFISGTTSVTALDNDAPALTLSATPTTFSEGAGANASTATVTRIGSTTAALTVNLNSSTPSAATVPATVTIPAGSASTTFAIAAINDAIVDGTQTTTISASAAGLATGTVTLNVTDNDSAALRLTISPSAFYEDDGSGAATATVTRNTLTTSALVVNLASSDITAATVPATVTIPAGSASVSFLVAAVNDNDVDGDQVATISASATGLLTGKAGVTVLDDELEALFGNAARASFSASATAATPATPSKVVYIDGAASQSSDFVRIQFSGALNAAVAESLSHYVVAVNGEAKRITSVSYNGTDTVRIYLAAGSLRNGDKVVVFWNQLRDAQGAVLTGQSDSLFVQ